jgi:hypothetical protein
MKRELREWLSNVPFSNPKLITLAHKWFYDSPDGRISITPAHCRKNLTYFLNERRPETFRRSDCRKHLVDGRLVRKADFKLIAALEEDSNYHPHYHLLMDFPTFRHQRLTINLWFTWPRTRWGYDQIKVTSVTDVAGCVKHITKQENDDMTYGIDWKNTNF